VFPALLPAQQPAAPTVRLKDIAQIRGVRTNQLVGYGIVVGLEGTGDSNGALFTVQSVANMLERFGITVPPNALKVKNVAAVMVTAELPPFARAGNTIDVVVSSIGDARSLQGGTLLQTPLRGADGQVYAVAQGPLSIGGFNFGGGGARVQRNHTTVGRIPNGALIEREVPASFLQGDNSLTIQLHKPDFTTAARVVSSIRSAFPNLTVRAVDPSTVRIALDAQHATDPVMLIAQLETLTVLPDIAARVVVNERTGTVVVNGDVRVAPVAIAHGGITVRVQTTFEVSQPPPLSEGQTKVVPQTQVDANEGACADGLPARGCVRRIAGQGTQRAGSQPARPDCHPAGTQSGRRTPRRNRGAVMETRIQSFACTLPFWSAEASFSRRKLRFRTPTGFSKRKLRFRLRQASASGSSASALQNYAQCC
jgi:flagellar P-ring protein precursor FlgI